MIVEMLPVQFITMVEVLVIMHGAISCAQILSAKLEDNDCLVVMLKRLLGRRATEAFVLLCATQDNAYRFSRL